MKHNALECHSVIWEERFAKPYVFLPFTPSITHAVTKKPFANKAALNDSEHIELDTAAHAKHSVLTNTHCVTEA